MNPTLIGVSLALALCGIASGQQQQPDATTRRFEHFLLANRSAVQTGNNVPFARRFGVRPEVTSIVGQSLDTCYSSLMPVERQIADSVKAFRAQFPGGFVPKGIDLAPPANNAALRALKSKILQACVVDLQQRLSFEDASSILGKINDPGVQP